MMSLAFKVLKGNWQYVFILFCALALTWFGFYVRSVIAENQILKIENSRLDEKIEIAALEINQCSQDKVLTEKVSNDYQKSIANLRTQLNRLRNDPHCIPTESPSSPGISPNTGGKLSGGNGIRSDWLYDFAGRAEQDRLTAKGCVDFMDQLYKSRGYND